MMEISRVGSEQLTATQALTLPFVLHGSALLVTDHVTPTLAKRTVSRPGKKRPNRTKKTREGKKTQSLVKNKDRKKTDEE
jgi:hypothetical protein